MKAPNGFCPWGATGIVRRIEEYGIKTKVVETCINTGFSDVFD